MREHTALNAKDSRRVTHLPPRLRPARGAARARRGDGPAQIINFPAGTPRNPQPVDLESLPALDIGAHLITRPGSTVLLQIKRSHLRDAGIFDNALLIVDLC